MGTAMDMAITGIIIHHIMGIAGIITVHTGGTITGTHITHPADIITKNAITGGGTIRGTATTGTIAGMAGTTATSRANPSTRHPGISLVSGWAV